jgi:hypothetical protein
VHTSDSFATIPPAIQLVAYHEAGHAVMVRLRGRRVNQIHLQQISTGVHSGMYDGCTDWWLNASPAHWDPSAPYDRLAPDRAHSADIALIFAAGPAAERRRIRMIGADKTLERLGTHDEPELLAACRRLCVPDATDVQIHQVRRAIENLAMTILREPRRWRAVKAIAATLLQELEGTPEHVKLAHERVHSIISHAWKVKNRPDSAQIEPRHG